MIQSSPEIRFSKTEGQDRGSVHPALQITGKLIYQLSVIVNEI